MDLGALGALGLQAALLERGLRRRMRLRRRHRLPPRLRLRRRHLLRVARRRRRQLGLRAVRPRLLRVARLRRVLQRELAQLELRAQLLAPAVGRRVLLRVPHRRALQLRRQPPTLLARGRLALLRLEHPALPLGRVALAVREHVGVLVPLHLRRHVLSNLRREQPSVDALPALGVRALGDAVPAALVAGATARGRAAVVIRGRAGARRAMRRRLVAVVQVGAHRAEALVPQPTVKRLRVRAAASVIGRGRGPSRR